MHFALISSTYYWQGTEFIHSITLDNGPYGDLHLSSQVFSRMHKLKILKFSEHEGINLPEGLEFLPNELRVLYWPNYPLQNLPSTFCAKNLVELRMIGSNLQELWDGIVVCMTLLYM